MKRSLALVGAAFAVLAATGTPLRAQGSGVDQHSGCMVGRVGAGVASPCADGSAVYFSPAGLANSPSAITLGAAIITASNEFTYDPAFRLGASSVERDPETIPVPHAYLNARVSPRMAAGIGVFAPYGLGLEWPACSVETVNTADCDQSENFEGRYTGYDNSLRGVYIQPTLAYQVVPGRLSIGVGVDYVMGSLEVHQRQPGPTTLGLQNTDIADVTLEGDGSGVAFHLGAVAQLTARTSLGIRYLSAAKLDMEGDATFEQVMTGVPAFDGAIGAQLPGDQGVSTEIEFPSQLVVGVSFRPIETVNLLADWQRTGWESFDAFDIDFATAADDTLELGYENTNTFRFAADYAASEKVALRAGFRFNTAATPRATPLLPEGERNYYTLGLGYRATSRLTADIGFQHIVQPDRAGAVRPGGPRAGVYSSEGRVIGISLSYRFGNATSYAPGAAR